MGCLEFRTIDIHHLLHDVQIRYDRMGLRPTRPTRTLHHAINSCFLLQDNLNCSDGAGSHCTTQYSICEQLLSETVIERKKYIPAKPSTNVSTIFHFTVKSSYTCHTFLSIRTHCHPKYRSPCGIKLKHRAQPFSNHSQHILHMSS